VKLSQAAQVHLLKQQGQLLSQIASKLSIPVATVDGYLGIQVGETDRDPSARATNRADSICPDPRIDCRIPAFREGLMHSPGK